MKKLNVYPNAYYNYRKHRKDAQNKQKSHLLKEITNTYHEANGRPGYRMMHDLFVNKGIDISLQTIRKYMNVELDLRSITRKPKYRYHKGAEAFAIFENKINRDFRSKAKNLKWCIDFTYLFLSNKSKRYNCTIIDLYNREVVASVNSNRINTNLAIDTLNKALESRKGVDGVILHSDRGSQFTSKEFVEYCKAKNVIQSMSRAGCPYDNAPMERYFNTLKAELINLRTFADDDTLYREVNRYAYGWYNNQRPHTYNGNLPPAKVV